MFEMRNLTEKYKFDKSSKLGAKYLWCYLDKQKLKKFKSEGFLTLCPLAYLFLFKIFQEFFLLSINIKIAPTNVIYETQDKFLFLFLLAHGLLRIVTVKLKLTILFF